MVKTYVVWDVDACQRLTTPMLYGQAAKIADVYEESLRRAFMVLPYMDDTISLRRAATHS